MTRTEQLMREKGFIKSSPVAEPLAKSIETIEGEPKREPDAETATVEAQPNEDPAPTQ